MAADTATPERPVHLVYVTFPQLDCAREIARDVVQGRLAACANLMPGATSLYEWQGALCEERECVGVFKCAAATLPALMARIRELHPYEVPCIVSMPLAAGHAPFLRWVCAQSTQ